MAMTINMVYTSRFGCKFTRIYWFVEYQECIVWYFNRCSILETVAFHTANVFVCIAMATGKPCASTTVPSWLPLIFCWCPSELWFFFSQYNSLASDERSKFNQKTKKKKGINGKISVPSCYSTHRSLLSFCLSVVFRISSNLLHFFFRWCLICSLVALCHRHWHNVRFTDRHAGAL